MLFAPDGEQIVAKSTRYLGDRSTNNRAEYTALVDGLQLAKDMGVKHLRVEGDSELVVKQLKGIYRVKDEGLAPLHAQAQSLLRDPAFAAPPSVSHIYRAANTAADAASNEAIVNAGHRVHVDSARAVAYGLAPSASAHSARSAAGGAGGVAASSSSSGYGGTSGGASSSSSGAYTHAAYGGSLIGGGGAGRGPSSSSSSSLYPSSLSAASSSAPAAKRSRADGTHDAGTSTGHASVYGGGHASASAAPRPSGAGGHGHSASRDYRPALAASASGSARGASGSAGGHYPTGHARSAGSSSGQYGASASASGIGAAVAGVKRTAPIM